MKQENIGNFRASAFSALSSEAELISESIASRASETARHAFLLGARHGARAFSTNPGGASDLEEWRRTMLRRYPDRTWKRSIVELLPAVRFRPSDIYTAKRDALASRHPDVKSLSVATHTALEALMRDGVIARTPDGYAPAEDGIPLMADAEDPTQAYRPQDMVDDRYARLLGYALWTSSLLECNIAYLTEVFLPGTVSNSADKPGIVLAGEFSRVVASMAASLENDLANRLSALAASFVDLAALRMALIHGRPCHVDDENLLSYDGRHLRPQQSTMVLSRKTVMESCMSFEAAAEEANDLLHLSRIREEVAKADALCQLHLEKIGHSEVRIAAATARIAIEKSLIHLIALSDVPTPYGARPYVGALARAGILDADVANDILRIVGDIERSTFGEESPYLRESRRIIEELWRLARSPGIVRRAIMHRARVAGKAPMELPRPLPGDMNTRTPLLRLDETTISLATDKVDASNANEVIVEIVEGREQASSPEALVISVGSRVLGNRRALELVPWLIDEPLTTQDTLTGRRRDV